MTHSLALVQAASAANYLPTGAVRPPASASAAPTGLASRGAPLAFVSPNLRPVGKSAGSFSKVGPIVAQPPLSRLAKPAAALGRDPRSTERPGGDTALNGGFNLDDFLRLNNLPNPMRRGDPPPSITFEDVAGVDEAITELSEIVEFFSDPKRFKDVGAEMPKGVLLAGPPGTGKTLLAKAVAGEAKVPFLAVTGSEFVEVYVGKGAARVRDLFNKANRMSPCIIFIDEIDAVGKQRGTNFDGGGDERAQTLNQLLTEMDGFNSDAGVVVIAATNRIDVLDDALLRPGRFDRHVVVGLPDRSGRIDILEVHSRNKNLEDDVDFEIIARRTPGFSGADLANLLKEAAMLAARDGRTTICQKDINDAIERVLAGPEKANHYISDQRKRLVAYHEAGHALVGAMLPEFDTVQKISIVPRGSAAGLTWFTPPENVLDSGLYTYGYLKNQIAVALGGRIAEEMIFGPEGVTTGASNDLQKVTAIARQMVKAFGMGGGLPMNLDTLTESAFVKSYSEETARKIDEKVESLVMEAYEKAKTILEDNIDTLHAIADELIDHETVECDELKAIITKHTGRNDGGEPKGGDDSGNGGGTGGVNLFQLIENRIKDAMDPWNYLK